MKELRKINGSWAIEPARIKFNQIIDAVQELQEIVSDQSDKMLHLWQTKEPKNNEPRYSIAELREKHREWGWGEGIPENEAGGRGTIPFLDWLEEDAKKPCIDNSGC